MNAAIHWHGYVERCGVVDALDRTERIAKLEPVETMETPEEVATWMRTTIQTAKAPTPIGHPREAMSGWPDEMTIWTREAQDHNSVQSGTRSQLTVTAEAIHGTVRACGCAETPLKPVRGARR
jgi:hypothetical protein